ncbi:retrovirus-related pol polyprotein from transposon TNT 1-94 [Tanacetum coccineum]
MFEKEKLSGNNFNEWFARLKLVLRVEKKMHVIEQPLPPAPEPVAEPNVVDQWTALYDAHTEIACLMLGSMTPELHRQFELYYPFDMIQELRSMFEKQAGVEKFDLIQSFHACKQEEGKPVADYVLKMKGYVEKLERLGYVLPQDISVGLILNGLTKDFVGFVRNYNMHNMGKTIGEIHVMLIEYEKGLPKKAETPQGKGKDKKDYIPKPKNPKPTAMERPAKDDACHHCKEVGHWKRNCHVYLAELQKKRKQVGSASSSDLGSKEAKTRCSLLYCGHGVRAQVEAIGSFDLVLPNGLVGNLMPKIETENQQHLSYSPEDKVTVKEVHLPSLIIMFFGVKDHECTKSDCYRSESRRHLEGLVNNLISVGLEREAEEKSVRSKLFFVKNASCLGLGNAPSLPNMSTTDDMFGLSSRHCCTHNKPTSIDLKTSDGLLDSTKLESMSSIDLPY